jgi:nuclear polyadenylated RNA-binding protein 3
MLCHFRQLKEANKSTGNLPSEKVTKRDLFHVFHKYGKLAQVSIKQAYGFIQFHEDAACLAALNNEQGSEVRGRKMRK